MNLYVVRHGQTDWNKNNRLQGLTNIPLNNTGILQAHQTAFILQNIEFDNVYCSPLKRTCKTAEIILENKNSNYIIDNRLIERGFGNLEGMHGKDLNIEPYWNFNTNLSTNNVENIQDFFARIYSFLEDISSYYKNSDKNILIVTHNGVVIAINALLNNVKDDFLSLGINPCEYRCFKNINLNGGNYGHFKI